MFTSAELEMIIAVNVIESAAGSAHLVVLIGSEDKREARLEFFEIMASEA